MNRLIVILTLSVVATGLVPRTQHAARAASDDEPMKKLNSSGQDALPHNAIAFCNAEAYVFHWRITCRQTKPAVCRRQNHASLSNLLSLRLTASMGLMCPNSLV